ncbi:hypothetical protein [Microbacterium sp. No. 7]|uniref:hypothetical protein n=1 Tax=Microbacterium sp. No. 7 TaxID=1714373 RepID=UPI0006D1117C|nr:hypothetical protein [Microbacterium sp. No. 7]
MSVAIASDPRTGPEDELDKLFGSAEAVRRVLETIHAAGPGAWRTLPVATDLLTYAQSRFASLARSWHRPAEDAAYAAFLTMREPGILNAESPWAVVRKAVARHLMAETQGERHLQSPDHARRLKNHPDAMPVRAGDDQTLMEVAVEDQAAVPRGIDRIVQCAAAYLAVAGWPAADAAGVAEYVCQRISDLGSQESAVDVLRRDHAFRQFLQLSKPEWAALVRLLVGSKPTTASPARPGLLVRVLSGESLAELLADERLRDLARQTLPGSRP